MLRQQLLIYTGALFLTLPARAQEETEEAQSLPYIHQLQDAKGFLNQHNQTDE